MQPNNVTARPWFYGFQMTLGATHTFRARLRVLGVAAATVAQRGELRLAVLANGAVPAPSPHVSIGWRSASTNLRRMSYLFGNNAASISPQAGNQDTTVPSGDCEVVLTKLANGDWLGYAAGSFTASLGIVSYGGVPAMSTGATVWVGFVFTPDAAMAGGSVICAADYYRQQDDLLFYG